MRVIASSLLLHTVANGRFDLPEKVLGLRSARMVRSLPVRVATKTGGVVAGRDCTVRRTQEASRIAYKALRQ